MQRASAATTGMVGVGPYDSRNDESAPKSSPGIPRSRGGGHFRFQKAFGHPRPETPLHAAPGACACSARNVSAIKREYAGGIASLSSAPVAQGMPIASRPTVIGRLDPLTWFFPVGRRGDLEHARHRRRSRGGRCADKTGSRPEMTSRTVDAAAVRGRRPQGRSSCHTA